MDCVTTARRAGALLLCLVGVALAGCVTPAQPSSSAPIIGGQIYMLVPGVSRSISPENLTGEKGMGARATIETGTAGPAARNLGQGWKVNPYINIKAGDTFVLGEAAGPGVIKHIWMTLGGAAEYRSAILRFYWDDETTPSVEAPAGDFFAAGWGRGKEPLINSAMVAVNPGSGFNSFWPMPFRGKFRATIENRSKLPLRIYYQIDYSLEQVPHDAGYFHAQFRLSNRLEAKQVHTILDGVSGRGQYVGTYLGHGAFSPGWWGEGEVKFYIDGDKEFPTIAGTGEEDYFLGSYDYFRRDASGKRFEQAFSTLYSGFYPVAPIDLSTEYFKENSERRNGEYRWHIQDPIKFSSDLRVTIQSLGWEGANIGSISGKGTYLPQEDYLASVAYWYQAEPHAPFPQLPDDAHLAIPPLKGAQ